MIEGSGSYLWLMNTDPGGPKTCGSGGSGSDPEHCYLPRLACSMESLRKRTSVLRLPSIRAKSCCICSSFLASCPSASHFNKERRVIYGTVECTRFSEKLFLWFMKIFIWYFSCPGVHLLMFFTAGTSNVPDPGCLSRIQRVKKHRIPFPQHTGYQ